MMTREEVLARKPAVHEVPVDGDKVHLREMTCAEMAGYEMSLKDRPAGARERLLICTVCDESGKLLFTDADIDALGRLPSTFVGPLCDKAREIHWKPKAN